MGDFQNVIKCIINWPLPLKEKTKLSYSPNTISNGAQFWFRRPPAASARSYSGRVANKFVLLKCTVRSCVPDTLFLQLGMDVFNGHVLRGPLRLVRHGCSDTYSPLIRILSSTFPIFYGICMEAHTCEANLPHINGNVVRKFGMSWDTGAVPAPCPLTVHAIMLRMAACDVLSPAQHRPATRRLSTLLGTRHPYLMPQL